MMLAIIEVKQFNTNGILSSCNDVLACVRTENFETQTKATGKGKYDIDLGKILHKKQTIVVLVRM